MVFRVSVARLWPLFACVLVVLVALYLVASWLAEQEKVPHPWHTTDSCSDNESAAYLDRLCRDYLSGVVGGSLCEPLCVRKEVKFVRCLGHGVKLHVLLAEWRANSVVLKTTEPVRNNSSVARHVLWYNDRNRLISKQEFLHQANLTLFLNLAGGRGVPRVVEVVEWLFSECDVLGDGQLSYSEAVVCWSLLEADEFVLLSLLRGISAIPDLYGVCGNMYATQFATSQPFLDRQLPVLDNRSWNFRAQLAISLIELVASLETTPHGTLYLCDVKGPNFGVVRQLRRSKLTSKAIDLDLSWFQSSSGRHDHHWLKQCLSDSDCSFVDCQIACREGTCSGPVVSNNLQVVCSNLLVPYWWQVSLLHDPPASIAAELRSTLNQCSLYSSLPQPHMNTTIMNKLLSLLKSSLHQQ